MDAPPSQAEQIFAAWLAGSADSPFDDLLRNHPALGRELRALHVFWTSIEPVLRLAGFDRHGPASFAYRLRAAHGSGVDPAISLDAPSDLGKASNDLLKRLGKKSAGARYRLEGEVARGGMGAILRVWDEDIRRHLAMKVVLGKGEARTDGGTPAVKPDQLARFLEEAQVTGQLDHPGIVPVHELGIDHDGRVFFTMKLVKGRDLKSIYDLVFEGKEGWNETRALSVILKVCEAVAYAHKKGVIHRDLKPANVMVGDFGEVYVMDWGLARVIGRKDQHDIRIAPQAGSSRSVRTERREEREATPDSPIVTMDGTVVGTPSYMSPEQARGEVEVLDARADVYAIGAMLYHLLAQRVPFVSPGDRASGRTILARLLDGPPAPIRALRVGVPAELEAICELAMMRNSAARYPDTLALANDLRAYLERRVVHAYEVGVLAETKKWLQRNTPLALALASSIALLALGLGASLMFKARADARADELLEANGTIELRNADLAVATRVAQEKEREALRTANDVLSLSVIQDLRDLEARADSLWPAHPETLPLYEAWLTDASHLITGEQTGRAPDRKPRSSLADHEARLGELRRTASPRTQAQLEADSISHPRYPELETARAELAGAKTAPPAALLQLVAELEAAVSERQVYEFADVESTWWHAQLSRLVSGLKNFADPGAGGLYSSGASIAHGWGIVKRAEFARTIDERSVSGTDALRRWKEARIAIADDPKYDGLVLNPQMGLLPLGPDPASGLWEFAHLQTGAHAKRLPDGKLDVSETMGLVLVLIPGATFWMGAQRADSTAHNFDSQAEANEGPVHAVTLSPFFMSKYELTQGQWERCTGSNTAYFGPSNYDPNWNADHRGHVSLLPMENINWNEVQDALRHAALMMPTEAQWEYAARAGSKAPYCTGADPHSLEGAANIGDATARACGYLQTPVESWLNDGNCVAAVIGSYRANDFGLHDTAGNVWEWCQDHYETYTQAVDPGTGLRHTQVGTTVVSRGGFFASDSAGARSANRHSPDASQRTGAQGVRPARSIAR